MAPRPHRVIWFVGLPGSGKSTVAKGVYQALRQRDLDVVLHQMDAVRKTYFPNPTYSPEEREQAYKHLAEDAVVLSQKHAYVLVDATAHVLAWRTRLRASVPDFTEVYVKCPLETALEREHQRPEGFVMANLYTKALERKKTGKQFNGLGLMVGVDEAFEENPAAELVLHSDKLSADASTAMVLAYLGLT